MRNLTRSVKLAMLFMVAAVACEDRLPPTITPLFPKPGDTVCAGDVEFYARVFDNTGVVEQVFFFSRPYLVAQGGLCEPDTYYVNWNTVGMTMNQWHDLTVTARDTAQNEAETTFSYYLAP
ncbi:hypothetical protein FJY69_09480 [candidate division WOR-3 bacterium]|nr:hypothetical protein [candidate division WOR-3 bacterium]